MQWKEAQTALGGTVLRSAAQRSKAVSNANDPTAWLRQTVPPVVLQSTELLRLWKRADCTPERYQSRIDGLNRRVGAMAHEVYEDADARRLTKRLGRYGEYLFTFLDYLDVPHDNNFGERQIRPAVILRKNGQSNRSDRGAATQAVRMSVYRALRLRGFDPTRTVVDALKAYLATGQLPPLPA